MLELQQGEASPQLVEIIEKNGLDKTKADFIFDNFSQFFSVASEWETKAKAIQVTNDGQTALMEQAREGRLILREKRLTIEKVRKALKEQSLREGKAIDGIANVLKGLIEPLEEYLDNQENFTKYRIEAEVKERLRVENEIRIAAEKAAEEKARFEDQENRRKLAEENAKLKEQQEIQAQALAAEIAEKERLVQAEKERAFIAEREAAQKRIEAQRLAEAPDRIKIANYLEALSNVPVPSIDDKRLESLLMSFIALVTKRIEDVKNSIKDLS